MERDVVAGETAAAENDVKEATAARNGIDAVLISHPFTDHAHPDVSQLAEAAISAFFAHLLSGLTSQTLASAFAGRNQTEAGKEQIGAAATLPIYTTPRAIGALQQQLGLPKKSVNPKDPLDITCMQTYAGPLDSLSSRGISVEQQRTAKGSRQATFANLPASQADLPGLPESIKIFYLPARESAVWNGPAWPELHGAVVIAWQVAPSPLAASPSTHHEPDYDIILYSPHGIMPTSLPDWVLLARRRILLHCLDRQTLPFLLGGCVALGFAKNGLKLCEPDSFCPQVYLATHDERKKASGIVAWLLKREDCDVQDAERMLEELWRGQEVIKGEEEGEESAQPPVKTRVKVLEVGEVFHVT